MNATMIPRQSPRPLFAAFLALLSVTVAVALEADDRDLLRERAADPYVFILFDTSGSMNLSPVCSAEDACEDIDPYDRACTSVCELGAACPQVCPDLGCIDFSDVDAVPPIEVLVDDTGGVSGGPLLNPAVTINGAWAADPSASLPFGGSAITDGNVDKGGKSVIFTGTIVQPEPTRRYKIFIHVPQSESWATNVPVTVSGTVNAETATVNQRFVPPPLSTTNPTAPPPPYKPWKLVGVYELAAGAQVSIRIDTDNTDGPVVVDGVRLLSEVKVCNQTGYRCALPLCPNGDCPVPLSGDDPGSKFYQAKQALYDVLGNIPFVRFGFGSFEQDFLRVQSKHWLYQVREFGLNPDGTATTTPQPLITLPEGTIFPLPGADDVFGLSGEVDFQFLWRCDLSLFGFPPLPGCSVNQPADLSDPYELGRIHRVPKLGTGKNRTSILWAKERANDPDTFRLTYTPVPGTNYGDPTFAVDLAVDRCTDASCSASVPVGLERIVYNLRSDFLGWDTNAPPFGFQIFNGLDSFADNSCGFGNGLPPNGWDPNDDTEPDATFNSNRAYDKAGIVNLKFLTTADAAGRSTASNGRVFDTGDVIPWDWQAGADHAQDIRLRLAPNTVTDPLAAPDFRVAPYLVDLPQAGDSGLLRLRDADPTNGVERPLLPRGATPLGASLLSFKSWFDSFSAEASQGGTVADPVVDLDWSCREKFVLMLTDGDETCGGAPCAAATTLAADQVRTFVVGFGLENRPGNQLSCIAANGGTDRPFFPRNKAELVATLTDIFGEVQAESRSFASASLPAVQSTAADKIYFSSFTPLPNRRVWPGRIDVFREPILDQQDPPVCRSCDRLDLDSGCQVWNAGDTILAQAPSDAQINASPPNANLGELRDQRRVLYPPDYRPATADGTIPQPLPLRLLTLPDLDAPLVADEPIIEDLAKVLVRPSEFDASQSAVAQLPIIGGPIKDLYRNIFRVKNSVDLADTVCPNGAPVGAPSSWQPGDYLLGDVFHTTTTVIGGPQNLAFRRQDLCGAGTQPQPNNCVSFASNQQDLAAARGFRNYSRRGGWYRRMLSVGANDGQLHFFDAGVRRVVDQKEVFSDGLGVELFSVIPRLVMPIVREQARDDNDRQIFSVDGGFSVDDVFIDPAFAAAPADSEREWRRVLVGGLREGGDRFDDNRGIEGFVSGYYALDITQPDGLDVVENDITTVKDNEYLPDDRKELGVLPSCLEIDGDGNLVPDASPGCSSTAGASLPFPAFKWEFADRMYFFDNPLPGQPDGSGWFLLDEDRNGEHDLANTWSRPLIGAVRVIEGGVETVKWVAIFGGGIDPAHKDPATTGNWLYMVDIETGTALYKRQVSGAVPADITGLSDTNGILRALYFGTTAGLMYKVDLREAMPVVPLEIKAADILGWPGPTEVQVHRVLDSRWDPFPIFDTQGKPIYQTPAVVQVPVIDKAALAWGIGDREDLWSRGAVAGRFYVILDDDFVLPATGIPDPPLTERDFVTFDFSAPLVGVDINGLPLADPPNFLEDDNLLTNDGQPAARGWIMRFPLEARITSRAFVVSGVLVFTVFQPRFDPLTNTEQPCRRSGLSRTFVLDARNGDALTTLKNLRDATLAEDRNLVGGDGAAASGINVVGGPAAASDCGDRCTETGGFGTAPFISPVGTKNKPEASTAAVTEDPLRSAVTKRLMANIQRSFYPPGCQFNPTFSHMIRMQFDNTKVQNLAPVPIGVCPSDWFDGVPPWLNDR